jgi:hypothetical protein
MALPTKDDLQNLDYTYLGQPFVNVVAKSSVETSNLDYVYLGQPFAGAQQPEIAEENENENVFQIFSEWKNIFSKYKSPY